MNHGARNRTDDRRRSAGDLGSWTSGAPAGDGSAPAAVDDAHAGAGRGASTRRRGAARNSWHMAYHAALAGHRWEDMLATGDAAVRIGDAAGTRRTWLPAARRAYLSALLYSRQQNSLDGVLRRPRPSRALGDREVVRQALRDRPAVVAAGARFGRTRALRVSQRWPSPPRSRDDELARPTRAPRSCWAPRTQ